MKKFIFSVATISLLFGVSWHNRLAFLTTFAPLLSELRSPVPANRAVNWSKGPEEAVTNISERPPNIILILADDLGFNDVSLYNGGAADGSLQTPNIDSLGDHGVRFNNAYSGAAVCAPARASLLTGRYSTRFGFEFNPTNPATAMISQWVQDLEKPYPPMLINHDVVDQMPDGASLGMPTTEITIAEMLKAAGYYTAHIGKWHVGLAEGMHPLDQGFDQSLRMMGVDKNGQSKAGLLYLPEDHPDVVNAKREDQVVERMVWSNAVYNVFWDRNENMQPEGYLTDYFSKEAETVIENNQHRPFFLYLAHWGVHNPLQATRGDYEALAHIEDHHLRVYAAMIKALDRGIGTITNALQANGLAENTLVLFTSDNGGAGYIGLSDINRPYRGWKLNHFEGGIHVPLIVKWPTRLGSGLNFEAAVHHVDLFKTIAAAAGVDTPQDRTIDGVSLLPFLLGNEKGNPHETLFWLQGHHQTVLHQGWKLISANQPDKATWLFNLNEDPTETRNLAAERPEKLAELKKLLAEHRAAQAPPLWPSLIDSPQLIDKHGGMTFESDDEYVYWPQ
ncbi:MAG: sulfatase-like hydrolase/transferase [Candidatus Azotimanducaceae bacterium]